MKVTFDLDQTPDVADNAAYTLREVMMRYSLNFREARSEVRDDGFTCLMCGRDWEDHHEACVVKIFADRFSAALHLAKQVEDAIEVAAEDVRLPH